METVLTTSPDEAAEFIKSGGIVAFPTETVYGLGANVFDSAAIAKIFEAKRRPADNPLIAHISDVRQVGDLTSEQTDMGKKFADAFFPGPLTIVLPKSDRVPIIATAGLDTIGVRMPRFELAQRFIAACCMPVVAPSANLSGRPSPTTWQAVLEDLDGRIDCILQGDPTEIGLESTVVDCTGEMPLLLRVGAVTLTDLQAIVPSTEAYHLRDGEQSRSPGVRHKHYSPTATVVLVNGEPTGPGPNSAYIGWAPPTSAFKLVRLYDSVDEYAHMIFEFFRECDRLGIDTIYCETVEETGLGAALMDRLRRASER